MKKLQRPTLAQRLKRNISGSLYIGNKIPKKVLKINIDHLSKEQLDMFKEDFLKAMREQPWRPLISNQKPRVIVQRQIFAKMQRSENFL